MKTFQFSSLLIAVVVLMPLPLLAERVEDVVNPKKTGLGWVSDQAELLSAQEEKTLNLLIDQIEKETTAEIAVVTINDSGRLSPREFATELLNRWGVGKKGKDNGVLIVVVKGARRIEVEVGYGLEPVLTDAQVGEILDRDVVPRFREGDFGGGLVNCVQSIGQRIGASLPSPAAVAPRLPEGVEERPALGARPDFMQTFVGLLILVILLAAAGWAIKKRRRRRCPACRKPMRLLSEKEDDAYLSSSRQVEESIGSVNYRVWRCDDCQTLRIDRSISYFSEYQRCPNCQNRTLLVKTHLIVEPTYERAGSEEVHMVCRYPPCRYEEIKTRRIPKRPVPTRSGGIWWGGSSSGSFGGFGGGSFGGGSSGGGGAGRGW